MTNQASFVRERKGFFGGLAVFIALDLIFIGLYITRDFLLETPYQGFLRSERWLIERDQGFPELYQYLKVFLAAALLYQLYLKRRSATYFAWFLTFLFVLLDDALQLHEAFGNFLLANFSLPTIVGVDSFLYVEALLWSLIGLPLLGLIGYDYLQTATTRTVTRRLAYLFVILFLFAGLADALHASGLGSNFSYGKGITTLLEDGGEMLAVSFMVTYIINHYLAVRQR